MLLSDRSYGHKTPSETPTSMTMSRFSFLVAGLAAISIQVRGQNFEGHLIQRLITVGADDLYEVMGEALYAEDPSNLPASLMELDVQEVATSASAEVENIRISVRGDLTRVEPDTGGDAEGFQVINSSTGTIWIVNVPDKSYVEFSRQSAEEIEKKTREMMQKMGVDPDEVAEMGDYETPTGNTVSTGRTAQINGYRATAYTYSDDEQVEVGWCASDETNLFESMKNLAMESAFADEEDEMAGGVECPEGTFPVRTLSLDLFSQELMVDDLVEVQAGSIPAGLFEVPSGFRKKDFMEGFFGQ